MCVLYACGRKEESEKSQPMWNGWNSKLEDPSALFAFTPFSLLVIQTPSLLAKLKPLATRSKVQGGKRCFDGEERLAQELAVQGLMIIHLLQWLIFVGIVNGARTGSNVLNAHYIRPEENIATQMWGLYIW